MSRRLRKQLDQAFHDGRCAALAHPTIPLNTGAGENWPKYHQWAYAAGHRDGLAALKRYEASR